MADLPSADFSINGGGVGLKVAVTATGAVVATIDDITGVAPVSWEIVNVDDTSAVTDYVLVLSGSVNQICSTTALTAGKSAELKCTVNGGIDPRTQVADRELMSSSVKFYVETAATLETLVSGELEEENVIGSPTHGAIEAINDAIRVLGTASGLVTTTTSGTVLATGATANAFYQAGAPTDGGAWTTYFSLGATPATAGDGRLHDTFTFQKWGTGPVNVPILEGHADDDLSIGLGSAAGANPPEIRYGANATHDFYVNGNSELLLAATFLEARVPIIRFDAAEVAPKITQEDDATAGVSGDDLSYLAQTVTDPAGGAAAGNVLLRAGRGAVHVGNTDGNVAVHEIPVAGWHAGEEIVFVSDCVLPPTAAPAAGVFAYAETGATKIWSSGDVVNTVSPVGSSVTIEHDTIAEGGQSAGGATVDLLSYTIANGQILHVHVTAGARDTVSGDVASYERIATFEQTAGGLALVGGVTAVHTAEEDAGWDATMLVVGAAAVFRGTGDGANATDWDIWAEITIVG